MIIATEDRSVPHQQAIARAVCDDCKALGLPVECRTARRKNEVDDDALLLAERLSGFILTFKPEGRRGRYSSTARCRVCARKAYDEQVALGAAGDEELRERLGVKLGLEPDPERSVGWKKYYKERDRRVVETAGPWRPR